MWNGDIHKYIHIHTYFLSSTFDFEACKCTTHSKVNSIHLLLCHISQASFSVFPTQWQHTCGFPTPSLLSILHTEAMLAPKNTAVSTSISYSSSPRLHISHRTESIFLACPARPSNVPCPAPYGDLCVSHPLLSFCPSTRMFSHHPRSLSVLDFKPQFNPFSINSSRIHCSLPSLAGRIPFSKTPAHAFAISLY